MPVSRNFVLIRQTKAVRPYHVMGFRTKRMAEFGIGSPEYVSRRPTCGVEEPFASQPGLTARALPWCGFGNVLVPFGLGRYPFVIRQQIAAAGPITVTHPDITRLLHDLPRRRNWLDSGGLHGKGVDVFVLDMASGSLSSNLAGASDSAVRV